MPSIRVLIIDDSALMRELLTEVLSRHADIDVVGSASDPVFALEKIERLRPDVLTLDVEMPRMDGLTFLGQLMATHPLPVVMVSSLTEKGCAVTLRALELGAVDFVTKPRLDIVKGTVVQAEEIVEKVRAAALAHVRVPGRMRPPAPGASSTTPFAGATHKVVAVGASTGGTEALRRLIEALPPAAPGMVVVQHMPERFTQAFATRLDGLARVTVKEAVDGDLVVPGMVLIAPGNQHMKVTRSGAAYVVRVGMAEPVNHHRPSVDVLFHSCARHLGSNAVGVILTGMGADGAKGLLAMRRAGARTVAQDEATCVVFGMPREAIALGAVESVLPLEAIADAVLRLAA